MTIEEKISKIISSDVLTAARLIRQLENGEPEGAEIMQQLRAHTGHALIIGITGAPGAGKSSLLGCLIKYFRKEKNMTVGVVAVDPSSPVTGGAFLGDRLRMQGDELDDGLFIRSLASRGRKGGLSDTAADTVLVMDAMRKDVVFIEAVGSGQSDIDIAGISDCCIAVLVPGMGDEIQLMKAGFMEIGNIFAINKADMDGAESMKALLQSVLAFRDHDESSWVPPVVLTQAVGCKGADELGEAVLRCCDWMAKNGQLEQKRQERKAGS